MSTGKVSLSSMESVKGKQHTCEHTQPAYVNIYVFAKTFGISMAETKINLNDNLLYCIIHANPYAFAVGCTGFSEILTSIQALGYFLVDCFIDEI